jgi:hypothetical protein
MANESLVVPTDDEPAKALAGKHAIKPTHAIDFTSVRR